MVYVLVVVCEKCNVERSSECIVHVFRFIRNQSCPRVEGFVRPALTCAKLRLCVLCVLCAEVFKTMRLSSVLG
jgi:hypothetical protein